MVHPRQVEITAAYDGEAYTNRAKFPRTDKRPQLFDLIADPHETKNLASNNPTVVAELAKKNQTVVSVNAAENRRALAARKRRW